MECVLKTTPVIYQIYDNKEGDGVLLLLCTQNAEIEKAIIRVIAVYG